MSKIAQYLNEHIVGEITANKAIRESFSRDQSVLAITPELVLFPRVTNDIRKAARFSWQLAEKGHTLAITARGAGTDPNGGAIGKGIVINTTQHLNSIIHLSLKDKDHFVHVQPGTSFKTLNDVLGSHGLSIPTAPDFSLHGTIGGAVAKNSGGQFSGQSGLTGSWVKRLEVVLANGDLIETTRLSRREVSKKIGLQTFEGEIYRKIDGLIEDNQQLINDALDKSDRDNTGYARLADVKHKDGSFDLTPLFIGSQGTLGIISEIVLRTDFVSKDQTVAVALIDTIETARDIIDALRGIDAASLELIDGTLYDSALSYGKAYPFFDSTDNQSTGALIYIQFNDFSDSARGRKLKKTLKILSRYNTSVVTSEKTPIEELLAIRELALPIWASLADGDSQPPLIDGAYIPSDRHEEFSSAVAELAQKNHVNLPIHIRALDNIVFIRPTLNLSKVGDKQKVFKIVNEYAQIVDKFGGIFVADGSEGRLKANAAYSLLDDETRRLYEQVRVTFDPFGTLNPGVKQSSDLKDLVDALRHSYNLSDVA